MFIDEAKITRELEIEKAQIKLRFLKEELKTKEDALMQNFDTESIVLKKAKN